MKIVLSIFTLAISFLAIYPGGSVLADQGISDSAVSAEVALTLNPSFTHTGTKHVANGVALRNRTSGWIHLRGVPSGSTVVAAYLYWNFSDGSASGSGVSPVLFNGNRINGSKTADNADPCWGMAGNHTYRATVTSLIPVTNPNQDYEVVPLFAGNTSTTGQDPWSPTETQVRRLEGATLVVVYRNAATGGNSVFIYDALSGSMFSSPSTFTLNHPGISGVGLFTMSGADGQRGGGHDNSASNETGSFNGTQISGPLVAASDWDGSAGLPLPQLWDVHTHRVSLSGTFSTVGYTSGGDCLVPVVFIIQVGT